MSKEQEIKLNDFLIFVLNEQRYALPVDIVEVVVRMVEIIHMPGAPAFVYGVVNFRGEVIPVIDLRQKFGMITRSVTIYDHLIIIRFKDRYCALVVDNVCEVIPCGEKNITKTEAILPDMPYFAGVAKLPDGIILLNNPNDLFSFNEMQAFDDFSKIDNDEIYFK